MILGRDFSTDDWIADLVLLREIGDFLYVARASFFKEIGGLLVGSTQNKQWRIEFLIELLAQARLIEPGWAE